jgi:UDP-N-acetylmuramate dehydrogenase
LQEDVALAPRTTLGLGGNARYLATASDEAAVVEALRFAQAERLAVAILGAGSNLVVGDDGFDGVVIAMAQRGIELSLRGATAHITAMAGEPWDELVAMSVERELAGLECLSGIPGLVGATPIQNVGAYGQEVADTITSVRVVDRRTFEPHDLEPSSCGFSYRDSAFKREPGRFVVLAVSFALRAGGEPTLSYAELERRLQARTATPSLSEVRETVLELRREKSMLLDAQDENRRSAGSFFLNPIVSAGAADRLVHLLLREGLVVRTEDVPRFVTTDGRVKLAAGWLIERAGLRKGQRRGAIGLSSRHALSLVHHGGGSSAELVAFAREVRDHVRARFAVELAPEPAFLGFEPGFRL